MKSRYLLAIWCVLISAAVCLQGCPSGTDQIRNQGQTKQNDLDEERAKIAKFIESGKAANGKKYRERYKVLLNKYKKLVYSKPDSTMARYLYGFLLVDEKQKWKQFHACLRSKPNHFWCHIGRGQVYVQWKVKDRAEKDFLAAQKKRPERVEPLLGLAGIEMIRKKNRKAVDLYKQVLAKKSSNLDALYGLAVLYQRQNKKNKAIFYYQELLKHQPQHFEALRSLGHLYFSLKQMKKAADAYTKASKIRPKHFRILVRLATICETYLSQPWRALRLYERASQLPQSHFHTYYRLGYLRGKKGNIDGGIASYKQALRLQSEHPGALLGLGLLYLKKHDAKNSVATLWKALRLNNGKVSVRVALAKALEIKGDFAGVLRQYEQIIKLDPKRSDIKELMQKILDKIGLSNDSFKGKTARQVFHKGRKRVYRCYKTRLKKHPKLKGKVAIKLIINPTGTVDRVTILIDKTTLDDNLVHACIKWTYRRAIFPRLRRNKQYQIKSELQFSKP